MKDGTKNAEEEKELNRIKNIKFLKLLLNGIV